jgi:succinate dehydrogenase (ubiquinone) flavoprotein subunit
MQKAMQSDAAVFRFVPFTSRLVIPLTSFCRTQQTLDEGVEKVRAIYKNFENVGIKDRSMIWNS